MRPVIILFGAICPARGVGSALVLPIVNVEAMNKHLVEISACITLGAIAVLIVDGAGWHRSPRLQLPNNLVLLTLPPYAPELNPVEIRPPSLGHLRRNPERHLRSLECLGQHSRRYPLNRHTRMGRDQNFGPMV